MALAVSPAPGGTGSTNLFAGTIGGGVFLSTNNGTNWTAVNTGLTNTDVRSFAISGTNLFAGTYGGGVFLSTNNGTNWTAVNTGLTNSSVHALVISSTVGETGATNLFAATDGGVFLSTNNGTSWTAVNNGLSTIYVYSLAVSPAAGGTGGTNLFVGTAGGGVFLSTNSGTSWTGGGTGLPTTIVLALCVIPAGGSGGTNVFAGSDWGGVFLSNNTGTSWTGVGLTDYDVDAFAVSGTNLFAATNGGVFLSTNNGTSWTALNTGLTNKYVWSLALSGSNLFAGTDDGGVFLSTNNGTSWNAASTGMTNNIVLSLAVSPAAGGTGGTNLYAGTVGGVFVSANNGASWAAANTGLTLPYVYAVAVSGRNLYAGTKGAGVWLRLLSEILGPLTPTLASPVDGATDMPTLSTLSWISSIGAETYRLQISTAPDFSTVVFDDSTIATTTKQAGPLKNNTLYYWRVSARNVGGTSVFSSVRSFRTIVAAPLAPALAEPIDAANNVSITPTLSWTKAPGATTYRLQVSLSTTFSVTIVNDSTIADTTKTIGPLQNSATYYWRVSAKNDGGTSAWSQARSFTTIVAAPEVPTLAVPADSAKNIQLNPALSWNPVPGAIRYHLQVSTSRTFTSVTLDDSTLNTTSRSIGPLSLATSFYWRLRAWNPGGWGVFSSPRQFSTVVTTSVGQLTQAIPTAYSLSQNYPNPFIQPRSFSSHCRRRAMFH